MFLFIVLLKLFSRVNSNETIVAKFRFLKRCKVICKQWKISLKEFTFFFFFNFRILSPCHSLKNLQVLNITKKFQSKFISISQLTFIIILSQLFSKLFQSHSFLVNIHNSLQSRLFTGFHFTCQVIDINMVLNGNFASTESSKQSRFTWRMKYLHFCIAQQCTINHCKCNSNL